MASPPTWAPIEGEIYGDWVGVRAPAQSLVFWDYQSELDQKEKVTKSYGTSLNGVQIGSDVDFAIVESEISTNSVVLPAASDVGLGGQIYIQAGNVAFRIRCKDDVEEILNGQVCSGYNELFVPRRCFVSLTVINDAEWMATIHNADGVQIPANPVSRSSIEVMDEYGYQALTAIDPTEIYTEYDGADDYFYADDTDLQSSTTLWSYAFWIKTGSASGSVETILANYNNTSNQRSWAFRLTDASPAKYRIQTSDDGTTNDFYDSTATYTADTWTHIAVTYNAGSIKLYVNNGAPETDTSTEVTLYNTNQEFTIAANDLGTPIQYFDGQLSHIVCEAAEWSSGTVSNIYNSVPPSTAHYFPFGNGVEKRRTLSDLSKAGMPTTTPDNIPTISSNTTRCLTTATNARDLVRGPQLRAGQECVVRSDTTHKMIFPSAINGGDIFINDKRVSDWKAVMDVSANYNYHIKALTNNEYEVLEIFSDGTVTSPSIN